MLELYELPISEIYLLFTHKKYYQKSTLLNKATSRLYKFFEIIHLLHKTVIKKYKKYTDSLISPETTKLIKFMMKEKKVYEVTNICKFLIPQIHKFSINRILDIGCGQGYLSYILASVFENLEIHGIDSKKSNIEAFESRIHEISKNHQARIKNKPADFIKKFKLETLFVTPVEMLKIESNFKSTDNTMLLTLHGCGDLSATLVRLFMMSPKIKRLLLISCCFNLLTENISLDAKNSLSFKIYSENTRNDLTVYQQKSEKEICETKGFPMSTYMKTTQKSFFLGRNIRCAAAAALSFMFEESQREITIQKMLYRAALEVFFRLLNFASYIYVKMCLK